MFQAIKNAVVDIVESIDPSNRIWVTLNQPSYVGGDMVTGTVELDCLVPFFARGVIVKVKGFERAWWEYQVTEYEGEGQNRRPVNRTVEVRHNREFFKQTLIVYPQQGQVPPGHMSFPFVYQLPANLPGTYFEEGGAPGNRYFAKIIYKAKASIDVAHRHNLHNTVRLVVNEKFDQLLKPSYGENSKSFLLASGDLHIRAWLDQNAYVPGQTVVARLKANNTSTKPTRRIKIKIHHALHLHAQGQHRAENRTVYQADFPGFDPCFYGIRWMPFTIPVGLLRPSSTLGDHVKSSYIFEIECDIPGAIDLSVRLPVRILAPQFLWSAAPPQPANAPIPPNVMLRPPWQPDEGINNCALCNQKFNLFHHRHHCRHCGRVYCADCTKHEMPIPKLKYKEKVRVCNTCLPDARAGGKKYQSKKEIMAQWYQSLGIAPIAGNGLPVFPPPVAAPYSPNMAAPYNPNYPSGAPVPYSPDGAAVRT